MAALKPYKGRGIVLHTLKYGDKSLIVHLLTDVGGRQSYMVPGIRSTQGRGSKAGLFQPIFTVEFEGLQSPKMQMHRFKEVQSGQLLRTIPFDPRKSTIALFMAEVLYRLIKESEPNPTLFDFVWSSVGALDELEEGTSNFHLWFLTKLSALLGFFPAGDYQTGDLFDIREGAYTSVCPPHTQYLNAEVARFLRDFTECDVRHLAEIGMNRHQRSALLQGLLSYYAYHLDAIESVRSIEILREVF